MAKKKDPAQKLLDFLNEMYTQEEIDKFEWAVDQDNESIYRMDFMDHNRNRMVLVIIKDTGVITLREAVLSWN